jgi:hypothetical protein
MSTTHGIPAASWQLQAAAEQKLKAIVLPLEGEPFFVADECFYYWRNKDFTSCTTIYMNGSLGAGNFLYQKGDRVYLQEKWAKEDLLYVSNSEDPNDDYHWFGEAEDMPPEAAQYWFEVKGVEVMLMDKIDFPLAYNAGLTDLVFESFPPKPIPGVTLDQSCENWNTAYPNQPWHSDRWVIVLAVEAIAGHD